MVLVIFIIVISILVFVHELGHFLAARMIGVRVFEFGFGFPPRALKLFTRKGTTFTLNWIPFGGFVKIAGEDSDEEHVPKSESLASKPAYQKIFVLLAGVIGNALLGFFLFWIVFSGAYISKGPVPEGALEGIQGIAIATGEKMLVVPVKVDGEYAPVDASLYEEVSGGKAGKLAIISTGTFLRDITVGIGVFFGDLFRGKPDLDQVAGPVGIAKLAHEASAFGIGSFLLFVSILSFNLAILNLLPIPALDGGRIVITIIESAMRKKISPKIIGAVHTVSFVLLLLLMVLVTGSDIVKLFQ